MQASDVVKKYWVLIVGVVLIALSLALAWWPATGARIAALTPIIQPVCMLLGWSLFFLRFLYDKSDSFYVRANNLRFWLTNETTKWDVRIELRGMKTANPLETAFDSMRTNAQLSPRVWHSENTKKILNFPGYTMRLRCIPDSAPAYQEGEVEQLMDLEISDLELPYRVFRTKLTGEIIPLLRSTVETLRAGNEKYSVKIGFRSGNPYFGFFVRKLELPQVVSFTCDILEMEVDGRQQTVTVRKDRIEITTDNVLALQNLSLKYVAFAL